MTMFSIIWQIVALSTFWCVSIYMNSEEGDIFYFLRKYANIKPIIKCINCMASAHTAIVMALYCWLAQIVAAWWQLVIIYVIAAIITAGTNGIIYRLYDFLSKYAEALTEDATKVD